MSPMLTSLPRTIALSVAMVVTLVPGMAGCGTTSGPPAVAAVRDGQALHARQDAPGTVSPCQVTELPSYEYGTAAHGKYDGTRLPPRYAKLGNQDEVSDAIEGISNGPAWACFSRFHPAAAEVYKRGNSLLFAHTGLRLLAGSRRCFDVMDYDRNGGLSRSEAERWGIVEPVFGALDGNGDGRITFVEFLPPNRLDLEVRWLVDEAGALVAIHDRDFDGGLTWSDIKQSGLVMIPTEFCPKPEPNVEQRAFRREAGADALLDAREAALMLAHGIEGGYYWVFSGAAPVPHPGDARSSRVPKGSWLERLLAGPRRNSASAP